MQMLLEARTNPMRVTAEAPERSIYWGDLHSHGRHSHDGVGRDPFTYARNIAAFNSAAAQIGLFALAFGVLLTGPGPISLDRAFFGGSPRPEPPAPKPEPRPVSRLGVAPTPPPRPNCPTTTGTRRPSSTSVSSPMGSGPPARPSSAYKHWPSRSEPQTSIAFENNATCTDIEFNITTYEP